LREREGRRAHKTVGQTPKRGHHANKRDPRSFTTASRFPIRAVNFKTPGIPRTSDGKPDLTAPAPRTPDGKPDLSGLWRLAPNAVPVPYILDVIQDIKDEAIFKPEAEAIFQKRVAGLGRDWPVTHCLPFGPAETLTGKPYRIVQSHTVVALLFNNEEGDDYRQIFLDGRELPKDPNPTWRRCSADHWEGDTLVVETAGFNDRSWLDLTGHPHSESLRVTEKFRCIDFGHIRFEITFNDPETMTRPLAISALVNYMPDTDMVQGVCENERDSGHLVGKMDPGVKLSEAALETTPAHTRCAQGLREARRCRRSRSLW